jgi:hypothetical protein
MSGRPENLWILDFSSILLRLKKYCLRKWGVLAVKLGIRSSTNYFLTAVAKVAA